MAGEPFYRGVTGAATVGFAITPGSAFLNETRAVWVGGAGNLVVTMAGNATPVTFTAVPAGTMLPIAVTAVASSGTTATNIVGLF